MPRFIAKVGEDQYLEWSTVVDAPVTNIMSRDMMLEYLREQYGRYDYPIQMDRLRRADEHGTSSIDKTSFEDLASYNRAGDNEECLTVEQIIEKYSEK